MSERDLREQIAMHGKSIFERGYTCGSSGNISVRLPDGILVTPTNCCLGRLDPDRISKISWNGNVLAGDKPSKESFLHLAMYQARSNDDAIVHLHSTYSVAVSCLADIDHSDVLPPITAYYVMKVGRLPLIPYFAPGDIELANEVQKVARQCHAMLLSNHGPVVAAKNLERAVYTMEELEETAKLYLLLRDKSAKYLTPESVSKLKEKFPN